MICPKCHTPLDLPVNICPHCGAGLQRSGGRLLVFTAAIVLLALLGVYGYINHRFSSRHDTARPRSAPPSSSSAHTEQQASGSSGVTTPWDGASAATRSINTGELRLKDLAGDDLGTYPVAVVSSGWFAFPGRFLIGARTWRVILDGGRSFAVEGAILQDGDPVGLWSVSANAPLEGLPLAPWAPQQPLRWHSLGETGSGRIVPVASFDRLGNFVRLPWANESTAGIFTQGEKAVGWSFGDLMPGGFLWTGSSGIELIPEFYTDDYYRLTFEGSREEAFLLALSDPSLSDIQRLTALAEAHLLEARMPDDILPERIAPAKIHQVMQDLLDDVHRQNRTGELLALFDPQTLSAVDSPPLIADLADAAREAGDYSDALSLLDSLPSSASETDRGTRNIPGTQAAIYGEWLNRLIAQGDVDEARSVYQEAVARFPQDPSIHLAGVELLLQNGNWALAARRLAGRSYPPALRERADRLEREIADNKSQEGKLLIRFRPGSRTVPVTANVGGGLMQPFLIDTGSSVVTIPSKAVRRLGIDISGSLPRRLFYSATGAQNAVEVTLPSIEIDGWAVANVKALVVDLPGQPGIGLLGMNYLRNFRLDLDTDQGLLTLAPR